MNIYERAVVRITIIENYSLSADSDGKSAVFRSDGVQRREVTTNKPENCDGETRAAYVSVVLIERRGRPAVRPILRTPAEYMVLNIKLRYYRQRPRPL